METLTSRLESLAADPRRAFFLGRGVRLTTDGEIWFADCLPKWLNDAEHVRSGRTGEAWAVRFWHDPLADQEAVEFTTGTLDAAVDHLLGLCGVVGREATDGEADPVADAVAALTEAAAPGAVPKFGLLFNHHRRALVDVRTGAIMCDGDPEECFGVRRF